MNQPMSNFCYISELKNQYISQGPVWLKRSYEDCVDSNLRECRFISGNHHLRTGEGGSHASQMMFFCGHEPHCQIINGEQALM